MNLNCKGEHLDYNSKGNILFIKIRILISGKVLYSLLCGVVNQKETAVKYSMAFNNLLSEFNS